MMILTDRKPRVDVAGVLTADEIHEIEHHVSHYPYPRAASLDALKCVQRRFGWVNDRQMYAIAQLLNISAADLEGVATFYNRIYRQPVGRHVILLCDSIACFLMGAETLSAAFQKELGIQLGQTTSDGRFTLLPLCCLGNCDQGPTLMIDEDTHGLVGVSSIQTLLEKYK
ncbi:NADH-quinone oxidoreductase subunit NuoE [Acinetobacter apis]|uniref:NADH-quinone oxidoreductase subunit E n=1 Tax=Acinetobacter apis TaxID=1229165 RepID=A0A217EFI2_9GAMM|nr:NADH-quinone oxidoreductase subunit NuoE [Acinetobacter apis]SNQ29248.1 NADH dehydrogenase subunit E [Acinetobacter apis]